MHLKRKEDVLEYLKFWLTLLLFFVGIAFPIAVFAVPPDINLTDDGKIPGQPFQDIYQKIDQLETILNNLRGHSCPNDAFVVGFNSDGSLICSDTGPTCEPPSTICDGQCVNLQTNPSNCGACGVECPANSDCILGTCEGTTQPGTGTCTDPVIVDADSLPFLDSRNLDDWGDNIQLTDATCDLTGDVQGNPDVVYSFTPAATRGYQFTLISDFDAILYITTQCDSSATCLLAYAIPQNSPYTFTLEEGVTYYLIITSIPPTPISYYYTLTIE